jgi:hypothetical protein
MSVNNRVFKDQMRAAPDADASLGLKKPPAAVVTPSDERGNDDPILPTPQPAANARRRQPIDIARAVANYAALPVLEITKRRMYRDWLNGRDLSVLQILYRDPVLGIPPRKAIEHTVREMARKQGKAA